MRHFTDPEMIFERSHEVHHFRIKYMFSMQCPFTDELCMPNRTIKQQENTSKYGRKGVAVVEEVSKVEMNFGTNHLPE